MDYRTEIEDAIAAGLKEHLPVNGRVYTGTGVDIWEGDCPTVLVGAGKEIAEGEGMMAGTWRNRVFFHVIIYLEGKNLREQANDLVYEVKKWLARNPTPFEGIPVSYRGLTRNTQNTTASRSLMSVNLALLAGPFIEDHQIYPNFEPWNPTDSFSAEVDPAESLNKGNNNPDTYSDDHLAGVYE